jgi:serine protease
MSLSRLSVLSASAFAMTILGVMSSGCVQDGRAPDAGEEAVADSYQSFEEFLDATYKERDGVWIADGDTPFETIDQLREFYEHFVQQDGALAIYTSGGSDVKWTDQQKLNLTYCVSTGFGSRHAEVVSAMASATGAWQAAANVKFVYLSQYDSNCTGNQTGVVFDVRPVSSGQYLARAFFPNTSRKNRNVLVDNTAFNYGNSPSVTGVLRHELGHALGFRHEHTRPEAGVCFEDNNWRGLTPYDSDSVMHYPQCNGTGNWSLTLTTYDKSGAASVYGAPGGGGGTGGGGGGGKPPKN